MKIDSYDPLTPPDAEQWLALGDATPVRAKLRQLKAQGPDWHNAVHAIASVLIKYVNRLSHDPGTVRDVNEGYYLALKRLNARKWQRSG